MKNKIVSAIILLLVFNNPVVYSFEKKNSEILAKKYQENPQAEAVTAEEMFFRGLVQQTKGNLTAALQDYGSVLEVEPNDQDTLANRCGVYTELGQYQNAVTDCQKAINLGGQTSQAINFNLGIAQQKSGDFSAALDSFQKFKIFANDSGNQKLSQKAGRRISFIQKALKGALTKSSVNDYFAATDEALVGNLIPAENLYRRAIRVSPHFAEAYLELANIKAMQKEYEAAIENYKEAERLSPELLAIYNNRAAVWIQYKNDYSAAKNDLRKAKAIAKKNGQVDVENYLDDLIEKLK